jgi:H+/Cl- antiporter ClcA
MTRRGSIVYYLSAWILGCFFMSLLVWIKDMFAPFVNASLSRSAFGLLFFYFYGLLAGALASLLGALLLRAVMSRRKCKTPYHWAIAGGILGPILILALGFLGRPMEMTQPPGMRLLGLLTLGPKIVLGAGWWLAIPSGAATAYLLGRIERAFEPQRAAA